MQNSQGSDLPYRIDSVDNVLRLLLLLEERGSVRVTDVSEYLAVARSTAHRLLAMLVHYRFAEQDTRTRAYLCGPVLRNIGLAALGGFDLRVRSRPYLERLARDTGETSNLMVRDGRMATFIESVEGTRAVRLSSRTGVSKPAHATSGGKVLLAELPTAELRALYAGVDLAAPTEATCRSLGQLEAQLAEVREMGYATNYGESEQRLHAVSVCLRDRNRRAVGALAVGGPSERFTRATIADLAVRLHGVADELGSELA